MIFAAGVHAWRRVRKLALLATFGLALVPAGTRDVTAGPSDDRAHRAGTLTVSEQYDEARKVLAGADSEDLAVVIARGRLALYEGDYDLAVTLLSRPGLGGDDEAKLLGDVSRGAARAFAATERSLDEAAGVEIRFQDETDRVLTPLLLDTVKRANESLAKDLGAGPPKLTRVVVVRDLLTLAAVTGLPYEAAQTTGTVAVAKWGRVTMLSPRASHHGYAFKDTLAHELTHLAITRVTYDRAPLWLQEGIAKREEIRWRPHGAFDDRPSPEAIVQRGLELDIARPLDRLGPSIAMLPSPDEALVAYAEVSSFVRYLVTAHGDDVLARLLLALRTASTVDAALVEVTGKDLHAHDALFKKALLEHPREKLSALYGLGEKGAKEAARATLRNTRERTRLAELLIGRNAPAAALAELDAIPKDMLGDPTVRYARIRALEGLGRLDEARELAKDTEGILAPFTPWWAIRGRLGALPGGDSTLIDPSFDEAIANDPYDIEGACRTLDPAKAAPSPLCDAARGAFAHPGLGRD